ncbi:PATL4 [Linum grandiflorum]
MAAESISEKPPMVSETQESEGQHQLKQPSPTNTTANEEQKQQQEQQPSSSTEEHNVPQVDVVEKAIDPQPVPQQKQQEPDQKVDAATTTAESASVINPAEEKRQESPAKGGNEEKRQESPVKGGNEEKRQESPAKGGNEAPLDVVNEKVIPVEKEDLSAASQVKEEPKEMVIKAEAKEEGKNADADADADAEKKKSEEKEVVIQQKEVTFAVDDEIVKKGIHEESSSSREQTVLLSDLKEYERKALLELKSKIEEAVLMNKFFEEKPEQPATTTDEQKEKSETSQEKKEEEESKQAEDEKAKDETLTAEKERKGKEIMIDDSASADVNQQNVNNTTEVAKAVTDISLWGAPLMPSKGNASTDVVLLKFLRAREFRVIEAFEMLKNTLRWRKENNIESILDEKDDQTDHLDPVVYEDGHDREGHPICYNVYGMLGFDKATDKMFGDEEKRERFMRWRIRKMERCVKEQLDFNPGGACEILQINDLKNTPLPTRKEVRLATRRVVEVLQDNYPEFVYTNIFINVPLWYYAFNTVLSPFLTPRTKNKFITARTSKVTEILLKYIAAEQLPVRYGGLKMDNDPDFCTDDAAKEVWVKSGSSEIIEIPVPEGGKTMVWDLTVSSWEVSYKEEFVPTNEKSYTIIIQKTKKINWQEGTIRNSFGNPEPGKILLTIDNASFRKKRILYRHKIKNVSSS